jgi:hypothetical protein
MEMAGLVGDGDDEQDPSRDVSRLESTVCCFFYTFFQLNGYYA